MRNFLHGRPHHIFDENSINKSPSIFDTNKLTWFNAEYTAA